MFTVKTVKYFYFLGADYEASLEGPPTTRPTVQSTELSK